MKTVTQLINAHYDDVDEGWNPMPDEEDIIEQAEANGLDPELLISAYEYRAREFERQTLLELFGTTDHRAILNLGAPPATKEQFLEWKKLKE